MWCQQHKSISADINNGTLKNIWVEKRCVRVEERPRCRSGEITPPIFIGERMKEKTTKKEEKALLLASQKMHRKIRIIEWLVPRIHKGISDPRNYEKLLGRVDPASHKPHPHK